MRKIDMSIFKSAGGWAVAISVIALVVSWLTWRDVHQQLRLFAGQIRSYVQVLDVQLLEPIGNASFIRLQLRIKNFGQTAAVNVYGEMDYRVGMPDPEGEGNEATRRQFGSMAPGLERIVTLTSNRLRREKWPTPHSGNFQSVYFFGTVWFTDDTTRENRKEDWCYQLQLKTEADLNRTQLETCQQLTYRSIQAR